MLLLADAPGSDGTLRNCDPGPRVLQAPQVHRQSVQAAQGLAAQIHRGGGNIKSVLCVSSSLWLQEVCLFLTTSIHESAGCTLWFINTFKYNVFAPMGRFQLELIYLYFPPSFHQFFLSCMPFVVITTLSICQLPKPGDRSNFNAYKTC